jgi:biopolymer transport protein ExbD
MGAVDSAAPRGHDKKKGKKKKKRRLGVRIDNTPLVDVAFLLLTFFMLTTTMNRPQTMEINLPPDDKVTVEIAESNLMTLLVKEDGKIFYRMGTKPPEPVEFKALRALMVERNKANPKLTTLIKIDRKGKYTMMVDIMDELNLADVTRFSLAPMEEGDLKALAAVPS